MKPAMILRPGFQRAVSVLGTAMVGLYPPAWRRRYQDEVVDILDRRPLRWRDAADLARGAADEWERTLARTEFPILAAIGVAYLVLVVVQFVVATAANFAMYPSVPNFRVVLALPVVAWVLLVFFVVTLICNAPLLIALRIARTRLRPSLAHWAVAAGFAVCGEWILYRIEWFDVWRHGVPGLRYWVSAVVPWGLAFATAGAIIGRAVTNVDRASLGRYR